MTPNQRKFRQEQNRIRRAIRRQEQLGYVVPAGTIPEMPARVTANALYEIRKITPRVIRLRSDFVDQTSGEIVTENKPLTPRQARRYQELSRREQFYDNLNAELDPYLPPAATGIIETFKSQILGYPPEIADLVIEWLNDLIEERGRVAVAIMLEDSPEQLKDYLNSGEYDSGKAVQEFAAAMAAYLPETTEELRRDLVEGFTENEEGFDI